MKFKNVILTCLSILLLAILCFITLKGQEQYIEPQIAKSSLVNLSDEETEDIGKEAKISSMAIIQRKTGTGPFDENDEPGNDSSENNSIVRTFDQVTWTVENTMSLKDGSTSEKLYGGIIQIKAEVPSTLSNVVKWDKDSMQWAEDATVSEDGTVFTANYRMLDSEITVPGKQSLVLVLKVEGATNGLEIVPTFTANLVGNEESEKSQVSGSAVTVSAKPSYNIQLTRQPYLNYRSYFDTVTKTESKTENENTINGRMQGYGVIVQLYNTNASKKLKGIELPKGDITFDIQFNESIGTTDVSDQEGYMPVLWDYKPNNLNKTGKNGNNMSFGGIDNSYFACNCAPLNSSTTRYFSCYNGGDWNIVQDSTQGNLWHVTISNYEFDAKNYEFPTQNSGMTQGSDRVYGENVGCFSAGYIQAILQFPNTVTETESIYFASKISNVNMKSLSDQVLTEDVASSDNYINSEITLYPPGIYLKFQDWHDKNSNNNNINVRSTTNLSPTYSGGESCATVKDEVVLVSGMDCAANNDGIVQGINILQKFDDTAVMPLENSTSSSGYEQITVNTLSSKGDLTILYAAKPDKTGWISSEEMEDTREEDLIYFGTMQELLEKGYTCVAVLIENRNLECYPGSSYYYGVRLKVKEGFDLGSVAQTVNDLRVWKEHIDYSWLNKEYTYDETNGLQYLDVNYPTPIYQQYNGVNANAKRYVKTAYDENGEIVTGTHFGGHVSGNSLLIVGANAALTIQSLNEDATENKVNFELEKNEDKVVYKIHPSLTNSAEVDIKNVNIKITTKLPKELTYISGSCNYNEPQITQNTDGTTDLVWYIYNCTVNQSIDDITFKANIEEEIDNGVQLEVKGVIEEITAENEISKIGNTRKDLKTATNTINVLNQENYALYKTTTTPVIELNGDIHFKVVAMNKTDSDLTDFQLLDILPYNGDGRGTQFDGTYTLSQIDLSAKNIGTTENININDLNLYMTNSENVRTGTTAKSEDLGTNPIWEAITSGANISQEEKAIAIKGVLKAHERLEIDIYLKANGNRPENIYKNMATVQTSIETAQMQTSIVTVKTIKRELSGKVWLDRNKNGIIDDEESYIENARLTLLNEDESTAKNIDGEDIAPVITNEEGYYHFENMAKGNYKLKIEKTNDNQLITQKNVGSNIEINSKFNSDLTTDIITKLNSTESPILTANYINAGITYKDATVTVHHYLEGTTNKVSQDVIKEGLVNDSYVTEKAQDLGTKYELVATPANATGIMTEEPIEVIYYYRLKDAKVTVKYLEKGTNEVLETEEEIDGKVDDPYTTIKKTVENYTFVEDTENTRGTMTEEPIEVIYYYLQNTSAKVEYIDKTTNEILDEKTEEGLVGDIFETTAQDFENYILVEEPEEKSVPMEKDEIVLRYYYIHIAGGVIEKHIDIITEEILDNAAYEGNEGDEYEILSKEFEGYDLVEEKLPENSKGTMTVEPIEVKYYYIRKAKVEVEYKDVLTEEKLTKDELIEGHEKDKYETEEKEFEGYDLVEVPENSKGTMEVKAVEKEDGTIGIENTTKVTYYYKRKSTVITKYVDKETGKDILEENKIDGHVGDKYQTKPEEIKGYKLITEELPENAEGKMTEEEIKVIYYYQEIQEENNEDEEQDKKENKEEENTEENKEETPSEDLDTKEEKTNTITNTTKEKESKTLDKEYKTSDNEVKNEVIVEQTVVETQKNPHTGDNIIKTTMIFMLAVVILLLVKIFQYENK